MSRRFPRGARFLCLALLTQCKHTPKGAPDAARGPVVRVFRARVPADLCTGPEAMGKLGDAVLDNGRVRVVIDDVVHGGGGFSLSGGQLVDAAPLPDGRDEIGQIFSFLGVFPRQLRYRTMQLAPRADGSAAVIVTGDDPRAPGLEGETVYALAPGESALTITTTLTNHATTPVEVGAGDAIQWSGAEHWAPGQGFALKGDRRERYLAGVGVFTAYAYAAPAELTGNNGTHWSNPVLLQATIAPGQSVSYVRRLGLARAGDVAGALAATGLVGPMPAVRVHVEDAMLAPIANARVYLGDESPGERAQPAALSSTDAHGDATVPAPPGTYVLHVEVPGRGVIETSAPALREPVVLRAGDTVARTVAFGETSVLAVTVDEADDFAADRETRRPVAARVLVFGENGTPDPMFGAIGRADGARNSFVVSPTHPLRVPIAPGAYRLLVTRGPERTLGETRFEVSPRAMSYDLHIGLRHALDTRGYLCGDFHTHQAPSLDSPVSLRDRARAAVAEGLELIASTDHNVATQLGPAVRAEGLEHEILALGGVEVSTDPALRPTGHWNIYPMDVRAEEPLGGAPALFDLDATTLVQRVRASFPGAVLQVNHPRSGFPTGMFDVVHFDRATGSAAAPFSPTFDALEIWNGRFQSQSESVMLDWFALLRAGARITGTANSDSHSIVVQEVGYPRTCIASTSDDPTAISPADVARSIRETRDVLMTDGPFVRVVASDGHSAIGRTLTPDGTGHVTLRVHVESLVWDAARVLEMVHADGRSEAVTIAFHTEFNSDVVRGDAEVRVLASEPFVLFRARGTGAIPVLLGDPPLYPLAITNPIYLGGRSSR